MVKCQGSLDQSCRSGGRLGVADLGLDRAEGAPWRVCFAVYLAQGGYFDRIANLGAGAVGFYQADAAGGDAGAAVGVE